jgi:hypothetical protein
MTGATAVSAAPFAVALVIGVGAFAALLPLLMADIPERRRAEPARTPAPSPVSVPHPERPAPEWVPFEPAAPAARPRPRPSRVRLALTMGALMVWSVWSVRRPRHHDRHL